MDRVKLIALASIAQDRLLAPGSRNDPVHERIAIAVSAALHAAAIGLLLLGPGRELPPSSPPLEIEMVQQPAEARGAPPPPAAAQARESPPTPPATPGPPAPSLPQAQKVPAPSAAAPPPSAPRQGQRPAPPSPPTPEVNLGNAAEDLDALTVTGENVVPPGPDARYRNQPPHYPAAAARIGAEGTVQLVARIAPNGLPMSVGVAESSGNADLDEEAKRAVLLWRFRPARENGRAVAYDYVLNVRFALGDR